jgi:hypothetical protein
MASSCNSNPSFSNSTKKFVLLNHKPVLSFVNWNLFVICIFYPVKFNKVGMIKILNYYHYLTGWICYLFGCGLSTLDNCILYQLYFKVSFSETLKLQWLMPIYNWSAFRSENARPARGLGENRGAIQIEIGVKAHFNW